MLQRTLNEYFKFYVKFNTIDFLVAYVVEFKTVKNDGKYEIEFRDVFILYQTKGWRNSTCRLVWVIRVKWWSLAL